ncbi:MAG: DNA/RNA non-specific endonuclease [Alistipes sp.]|nr:DNA/RNA non-specific endonuclease [Alistipes sp.]
MKNLKNILSTMQSINRKIMIVLVLVFAFMACVQEEWSPYKSKAEINSVVVSFQESIISGTTIGDPMLTWTLSVVEGGEYCALITKVGFVGKNFSVRFATNDTDKARTAIVRIEFSDGYTNTFTIKQLAKTENPDYDRAWGEQPAEKVGASLVYKTYYTTLSNNSRVRNFSICYDTEKLVAHWVAYPVHRAYLGSQNRTNAWSFDDYYYTQSGEATYKPTNPVIPQDKQQNIVSGAYGTGDQRGHMLPSATRLYDYNTNAQTFYATNMMPQNGDFNGGVWANLEGKVRGKSCPDTLFVVTGTLFESGSYQFTARGRKITRPSHAYKLLLRTRSGSTGKHISNITMADDLMCIGFLFENNYTGANTSIKDAVVSVAEIEKRTGFKFFRNLNPAIADKVKQQKNLSAWGM